MIDVNFIRAKIECSINQAHLRNLIISDDGWHIVCSQTLPYKCKIDNSGRVFILTLLLEDMRWSMNFHTLASRRLGISAEQVAAFNNGFCGAYSTDKNLENNILKDLGVHYRKQFNL